MPVKIRLSRHGRKKRPFYHIIVADARAPRDGRFIEKLGIYDPLTKPATIELDRDKAFEWLMNGAQPTDTARAILKFKGVLYRKHLMRGVEKGALSEEDAMAKYEAWIMEKEAKIKKRREEHLAEKQAYHTAVSGVIPKIKIKEEPVEEVTADTATAADEVAPETPAAEEAKAEAKEESPAAEEAKSETKEGAPAAKEAKEEAPVAEEPKVEAKEEAPAAEEAETKEEAPPAMEVKEEAVEKPKAEAKEEEPAAEEANQEAEKETPEAKLEGEESKPATKEDVPATEEAEPETKEETPTEEGSKETPGAEADAAEDKK